MKKLLFLVLAIISTISCSSQQPVTFTADQLFQPNIGQTWKFTSFCNGATQFTTFTIEAAPRVPNGPLNFAAGTTGTHAVLRIDKTDPCAYWMFDVPGAEDRFTLFRVPEGWRGVADISTESVPCPWCAGYTAQTINWHPIAGMPVPYLIIPASITEGQTLTYNTQYDWWQVDGVTTFDDISHPCCSQINFGQYRGRSDWQSIFTVVNCSTPAYTGKCVKNHQQVGCYFEEWYFSPIGLVQITPGGCLPFTDDRTIKRVL